MSLYRVAKRMEKTRHEAERERQGMGELRAELHLELPDESLSRLGFSAAHAVHNMRVYILYRVYLTILGICADKLDRQLRT